jgi:adenine-specific DNA-methyltransferase
LKTRQEVTPEKLRGGFYTPARLVEACLGRVRERLPDGRLRLLEPSAGDGAFVRALGHRDWQSRVESVTAIEPLEIEAEKCRRAMAERRIDGSVTVASAIRWSLEHDDRYDAAIGNPPFVRYQFISQSDRASALELGASLGVEFAGVSNLWIPVLLASLGRLRKGGAFAFVIPTEFLTGCSAAVVRQWLVNNCEEVCLDLFAPGSFPDVLQEVAVLSGRRSATSSRALPLRVVEHRGETEREWTYSVADSAPWTRYLLDPVHLEALGAAQNLPLARPLGTLVAFEVSIVTGANDFFSVNDATLKAFDLRPWARPLLPRARHAPGLVYRVSDQAATQAAGANVWLLDFAANKPDPLVAAGSRRYLASGEDAELQKRYKCRIREPWYRVPRIVRGELLLSKRSHMWPRVIVNEAESFTTDTIYRGRMLTTERSGRDVAAAFHNSLTLLTAELEGRSFGGGVLELVPSEIGRLTALVPPNAAAALDVLDATARQAPELVVEQTDAYLVRVGALPSELVPLLREARALLAERRFERSRSGQDAATPAESVIAAA